MRGDTGSRHSAGYSASALIEARTDPCRRTGRRSTGAKLHDVGSSAHLSLTRGGLRQGRVASPTVRKMLQPLPHPCQTTMMAAPTDISQSPIFRIVNRPFNRGRLSILFTLRHVTTSDVLPGPSSMFNLFEDNGQNPTVAASMLPPLPITEVKPAAATRDAEGAGLRLVMGRETIGLPARRQLCLLRSGEAAHAGVRVLFEV